MKRRKQKAKPAIKCTGAIVNPDADNPMPMVCDRCGAAVEAFRHSLFDFQVWRDGRGRSPHACGGRLCPQCGDIVGRMLVYFGKSLGLTTNSTLPGLHERFLGQGSMRRHGIPGGTECAPCPEPRRG